MGYTRVINRYAKALFKDAQEADILDKIFSDSNAIVKVISENKQLNVLLKNPTIQSLKKLMVLKKVFIHAIEPISFRYIEMIVKHKREPLLKAVFEQFNNLYKKDKKILEAQVVSAQALEPVAMNAIKSYLQKKTGARMVELSNKLDKNLIGGFMLRFQDKILDTTILSQLNEMKKLLLKKA